MSVKKLLLFLCALIQVAILGVTAYFVMDGQGPEIFIYLEAGFVALCLAIALIIGLSMSFGGLFFAFGGFAHIVLTLGVIAATGYYAVVSDDFVFIGILAGCSLLMLVSLVPILCSKR